MSASLEDHVVLFLDFLGFSEASVQANDATQDMLLHLLTRVSQLRANFSRNVKDHESGQTITLQPAVSTFSDNIVISFPFSGLTFGNTESGNAFMALHQLEGHLGWIARYALTSGFLIRGGVSLGKLYHADGVVFGPAMVEAYNLESRTAIYPRVVLSRKLTDLPEVRRSTLFLRSDTDGLVSIDYFRDFIMRAAEPGDDYSNQIGRWLDISMAIVKQNIERLSGPNSVNARSKWVWFAGRIYESLDKYWTLFEHFVPNKKEEWKQFIASL